jgi:hypothetical protein
MVLLLFLRVELADGKFMLPFSIIIITFIIMMLNRGKESTHARTQLHALGILGPSSLRNAPSTRPSPWQQLL